MQFSRVGCLSATLFFITILPLTADSLWMPSSRGMFADLKATQVGDLVTVLIVETSSASQKASSGFDKDLEHENEAGLGPFLKLVPEFGFSSSQTSSSSGQTTMNNKFITKLTAKVAKVMPNGDLLIEGERSMTINDEKQKVILTGTARPQDIQTDNTVLSTCLADVQITYTGKGPIGDRQKQGIISKLIKFLF